MSDSNNYYPADYSHGLVYTIMTHPCKTGDEMLCLAVFD